MRGSRDVVSSRLSRTALRMTSLRQSDFEEIHTWACEPDVAPVWMYRGSTPPLDQFVQNLYAAVLAQFVFRYAEDPVAIGAIYEPNFAAGHASVRLVTSPRARRAHTAVDSFVLLAEYGFKTYPLRKLYMQTNSSAIQSFSSALRRGFFEEEARLVDFERNGEEWLDLIYLSVARQVFIEREPLTLRFTQGVQT
jgi:RimJ/RimL family protein N-acetyltransferase